MPWLMALAACLGACMAPTIIDNEPVRTHSALVLHPATVVVEPGESQQFAAFFDSISPSTPTPATYATSGGTISPEGLFVAGDTPGVYQVIANKDTLTAVSTVTVTAPPALTHTVSPAMFGLHIQFLFSQPASVWPAVPVGSWRLHDTRGVRWFEVQPTKTTWDFTLLDQYVTLGTQHGVAVMLTLGQTPTWASARPTETGAFQPGSAAEPSSIAYWQTYVRTVVTRYKGKIKAYEIWNEPDGKQYYSGTPQMMVTLAREAYSIIKQVDPAATVVSPGETGGPYWLDPYLAAGGGNYADVIAYHFYTPATDPGPEELPLKIAAVKAVMAKYGQQSKSLWNTEFGYCMASSDGSVTDAVCNGVLPGRHVLSADMGASYLARAYLIGAAYGITRFFWYSWDNKVLGLVQPDRATLKPSAIAYREVRNWMVGSRVDRCLGDATGIIWTCQITRPDFTVAHVVWRTTGTSAFALPADWKPVLQRFLNGSSSAIGAGAQSVQIGTSPIYLQP
jgi:hypothetical protein